MDVRILVLIVGAAVAAWAFANWRKAIGAAMVLLVVEGAIRKWVVPGAQELVYFGKDVVLLAAYLGFLAQQQRRSRPLPQVPMLAALLLLGAMYGALAIFNPRLPNILVGVLGFKAYFFYVPLLFLIPRAFPSDAALGRFLYRYVLLSIPVGLLAVAQFFSPATSALNTYARSAGTVDIATFGAAYFVRVTGTFSYITGYASYLSVVLFLALGLLAAARWRFRANAVTYLALAMAVLGMLMTGSRGPVLTVVLLLPLYWWLAVARERGGTATFGRLLLGMGLVAAFVGFTAPEAVEAFYGRTAGSVDMTGRALSPLLVPLRVFDHAGLFGIGIGATHQTAAAVVPGAVPYSWLGGLLIEAESGQVMLELGALGFILIYLMRIYLVFFAFRNVLELRTSFHRAIATASLLFFIAQLPGTVVFNVTADVFYWFFAGLLLTVIKLDRDLVVPGKEGTAVLRPPGPARRHGVPRPATAGSGPSFHPPGRSG